jgi:hypothetical protein
MQFVSKWDVHLNVYFFSLWRFVPIPGHGLPLRGFAFTLIGHTTLGRTPLDEWSARRRDLYLTTHNSHNRQISMPSAVFEPATPTSERPQAHSLDHAATGTGTCNTLIGGNSSQGRKVEPRTAKYILWHNLCYCCIGGVIILCNGDVSRNVAVVSTHVSNQRGPGYSDSFVQALQATSERIL